MTIQKILPFVLLQFLYFHELHAQIPPTISSGSNITAGSGNSWRSLSDEFAFGFYPLPNNLYLVGIWFNKIPKGTLVWSANRDSPAVAGSTVILTSAGQLTLTHLNGSVVQIYGGAGAQFGFMQDDGNFVLKDGSSSVIWESFNSPTDTILPGQVLNETGQNKVHLVFNNDTASMYLANGAGDNIYALTRNVSTPVGDYYHRATINDRGDFQQFAYHKSNNSGWTRVWRAIDEPCVVNAICGVYGMCSSLNNGTATCNCIPGYIPLDPNHLSKGCRPETVVNYCADPSMRNFTIKVIDDADFPFEGFADLARVRNVDLEGCKKALMDDCYSLSASLVDSRCIKKRMPLLNARKSFSTKGRQALVKVPMKSNPDIQEHKKNNDFDTRVFLKISLIVTATLAFCFGVSAIYYHPAPRRFIKRKRYSNASSIGINFQEFKYLELQKATNGFSKTLGRGSSAQVYSGILSMKDIQIDIATFYEKGNTNVGGDLGNRNPAFTFRSNTLWTPIQRVELWQLQAPLYLNFAFQGFPGLSLALPVGILSPTTATALHQLRGQVQNLQGHSLLAGTDVFLEGLPFLKKSGCSFLDAGDDGKIPHQILPSMIFCNYSWLSPSANAHTRIFCFAMLTNQRSAEACFYKANWGGGCGLARHRILDRANSTPDTRIDPTRGFFVVCIRIRLSVKSKNLIPGPQYKIDEGPSSFTFFNLRKTAGPPPTNPKHLGPNRKQKKEGLYFLPYLHLVKDMALLSLADTRREETGVAKCFKSISSIHILREGNGVADRLAKQSLERTVLLMLCGHPRQETRDGGLCKRMPNVYSVIYCFHLPLPENDVPHHFARED
ncbi:hypothetical protein NC653_030938 [Populus alba x Populus x berolinensis]|uniref:Bulb-type lectin domain-containing protein n=1 Tax=Populus alba x Populus x berolinensis TaxID=444605 RepID=A0AAD6LX56_9ROSI|nr:hypothetical protein NC653_030938 [Populus alba x Populus x berolinensis]